MPLQVRKRALFAKFFADRGTHLAAMIAYFALLSFVPLTFLALALLGFAGRADESSFLVTELKHALPDAPVGDIVSLVRKVQDNAATLGIVGGAFLLWTSLSLFSVLESAFNIVYGKPNRSFLHGKAIASVLMLGSLVTLFVALLVGSLGVTFLRHFAPGSIDNDASAWVLTLIVSSLGVFVFVVSVYYLLTNAELTCATCCRERCSRRSSSRPASRCCPLYVRYTSLNPVLKTFGPPVDPARLALRDGEHPRLRRRAQLVDGGAAERPPRRAAAGIGLALERARKRSAARARCEFVRFHSLPSSATVRSSPSGTKIGS